MTRPVRLATTVVVVLSLMGCSTEVALSSQSDRLQVITTTSLLQGIVEEVGGDRVDAQSLIAYGADPHSYEPSLRDARNAAYADVAFSNYPLLEQQSVIRTLDANLPSHAVHVSLAEESVKYAAEIIPLVEDASLDTVWLGMRVSGSGEQYDATRSSDVLVSAVAATGPGTVAAYLTGSFGSTTRYLDSSDGFDKSTGYRDDTMTLPVDAHTHLSWAFSKPGVYTLTLEARLQVDQVQKPELLGRDTITFAVGVSPTRQVPEAHLVLDAGHADITVNLDSGQFEILADAASGHSSGVHDHGAGGHDALALSDVVVDVPPQALDIVPEGEQFSFLGPAGSSVYQLPQAVLGNHVHGEIDPHLWQNVRNVMAYVQLIRDTLTKADPAGARDYAQNAADYLSALDELDASVTAIINEIPSADRHLVTSHNEFAYFAQAYGLNVAGFVSASPAVEPSLADRRRLTETLRTLEIPAVFVEPHETARMSTLAELATETRVELCPIYGDVLDDRVTNYAEMMRFNAESLRGCLAN